MPTVEVNGVNLYHEQTGEGPPVLFVHGIPTDYRAWGAQVEAVSGSYQSITYSRRLATPNENRGDQGESSIENNSADLVDLIKKLGVKPVHLVGHSHGGFIAAYTAVRNPELVRTLTLVESAISTILVKNRKNPLQLLALMLSSPSTALSALNFQSKSLNPSLEAVRRGDLDTALRLNLDGIMGKSRSLENFPEDARAMFKENARTIVELAAEAPPFGREMASRITADTLLVNGAESPKFFRSIGERLARSVPKSEIVRIPGSSHFPHLERPDEFNRLLLDFLQRHN